jgi:hypothetical protein
LTDVSEVRTASIINAITLLMEAVSTSVTSVNFYRNTQRRITEERHPDVLFTVTLLLFWICGSVCK